VLSNNPTVLENLLHMITFQSQEVEADSPDIFKAPACLIKSDKDAMLKVNPDVLAAVERLEGYLVVVAITGLYRTGKSYLLNRLAMTSNDADPPHLSKGTYTLY
jgi:hypothetical protein